MCGVGTKKKSSTASRGALSSREKGIVIKVDREKT